MHRDRANQGVAKRSVESIFACASPIKQSISVPFVWLVLVSVASIPLSDGLASPVPGIRVAVPPAISTQQILPDTPFHELGTENEISIKGVRGEYEPASFVVHNSSYEPIVVQIEASDLDGSSSSIGSEFIDVKHVLVWYQAAGAWVHWRKPRGNMEAFLTPELMVNDPELIRVDRVAKHNYLRLSKPTGPEYLLISMRERNEVMRFYTVDERPVYDSPTLKPVSVPSGENHQFWVTVNIPADAKAGTYQGSIRIKNSRGDSIASVPVNLEVYGFELPPPSIEYSMYYRGRLADHYPTVSDEWKSTAQLTADLESMISHGISNPTCYQRFRPKDPIEKSNPVASRDLVEKVLEIRRKLGLTDRAFYFIGRTTGKSATSKNLTWLAEDARDLLKMVRRYGATDLYLYGVDEARGEEIVEQQSAWRTAKRAGAKVFVAGTLDHFERSGGLTDLLVYADPPIPDGRKVAAQQHGVGNKLFMYGNPQAGPEDPLLWRTNFGILLWQADYDGAMPYAFQAQDGSIWNDWDGLNYRTASIAYPSADRPISTIAFEGLREGIDDVRYLTALENAVVRLQQRGERTEGDDSALSAALEFLAELKDRSPFDPAIVRAQIVDHLRELEE